MRRSLVAGNWKMNLSLAEASAVVESLLKLVVQKQTVDVVLCPTYVCLQAVGSHLKTSAVALGAQDVFWKDTGAFTGRISAPMLVDTGCTYCIVGHSETRGKFGKLEVLQSTVGYFAETDETVNLKVKALLYHSLKPILCIGETLAEREAGQTDAVIGQQLRLGLQGIHGFEFAQGVVAYEPVWAIGTGKTCDAEEADRVCSLIRTELDALFGEADSAPIRILYGGSLKAMNAREMFAMPNIDGGLVGGASLNADEFSQIVLSVRR